MYPNQMERAFRELPVSEKTAALFSKELEQFQNEQKRKEVVDAGDALVGRIDRIGKGRFAQRLANKLSGRSAPEYISMALDLIMKRVKDASA